MRYYKSLQRAERISHILGILAYFSLATDIVIGVVTLFFINLYRASALRLILYVNYTITIEVFLTVALFFLLYLTRRYENAIDVFARMCVRIKGRK